MKKIVINCIIIFSIIITAIFLTTLNSYAIDRDPNSSKGFAEFDDEAAAQETQELIQEQQEEQENQQNTTNGDKPLEETSSDVENNELSNTDNQIANEVEETNSTQSSSVIEENVNRFSIDADLLIFLTIIAIIIVIIFITVLVRKSKGKK